MFSRVKLFEMCGFSPASTSGNPYSMISGKLGTYSPVKNWRRSWQGSGSEWTISKFWRQTLSSTCCFPTEISRWGRCSKCLLGSMLGEEGMLVLDFSQLIGHPRCRMEPTDNFPPCDFMMHGRDSHMGTTGDYDILIFTPQLLRYPAHGGSVLCCEPRAHLSVSQWELCSGKQQTFLLLSDCIFHCLKLCYWKLTVPGTGQMQLILCKIATDPVTRHTETLYHLYCHLLDIFKIWKVG